MLSFLDRVKGVLYGTAFGDAIGATIEKLSYPQIVEKYGRVESLSMPWHKADWPASMRNHRQRGYGIVTDDTLMTIALMNIYNHAKEHLDAWDMADGMVKEIAFKKTYIPELDREDYIIERLFYPEKWIFQRHALANCEPREGGIGNMINCGAAMYIAPVGIVNACHPRAAYDEAINFASGHQASYGLEAAGVLAACVAKAFEPGVVVDDIVDTALSLAKDGTQKAIYDMCQKARQLKNHKDDHALVVAEFQKTILPYSPMGDDVNRKIEKIGVPSNHYVPSRLFSIEELPFSLAYAVLHEGDFRKTIIDGVNSGRDTDSIGVMAGAILGAMCGTENITEDEQSLLTAKNRMPFEQIAERFAGTAKEIIVNDTRLEALRHKRLESILK
ncbi:ADP-ribosylglycohydrolase family protein [Neptunicella sp. SCSIO 80796]|uniref:ADP-ribosylglycohydrolase family protein n=1 Tax=Neptunicella plasticusilytica TaxID=3117012 RepID=UPI003A4D7276